MFEYVIPEGSDMDLHIRIFLSLVVEFVVYESQDEKASPELLGWGSSVQLFLQLVLYRGVQSSTVTYSYSFGLG